MQTLPAVRWAQALLALGCGVAVALGHAPWGLAPLALAGLAAALALLPQAEGPRAGFRIGWLVGVGHFGLALSWIVEPFLVDIARHGWMAPFALILSAGGFALFWGAAFAGAAALAREAAPRLLAAAALLPLAEAARATVLSGFPWALVGYVWMETPFAHAAALVGPHGLSLLTLLAAAGLALLGVARARAWSLLMVVPLGAVAAVGWWQAQVPVPAPGEALVVRLVQPNASQREKWDPDKARMFLERMIDYTAAPGDPDVVVWPETALPYWLRDAGPDLERIAAAAQGAPVLLGAQRGEGPRAFNSLVLLEHEGIAEIYDKHHLVPFGEYIPLGGLGRWLGLRSFAAQDGYGFSPGPGPRLMQVPGLGEVLPLICYEAIFPAGVAAAPSRPDWLVHVTNDAWFGTLSGPYQHLAQSRMRAIEQGLPLVRVANTGVSAVIDARGRVIDSIPLGEAGWSDVALPSAAAPTLYARLGDWPAAAAVLLLLCAAAWRGRRGR